MLIVFIEDGFLTFLGVTVQAIVRFIEIRLQKVFLLRSERILLLLEVVWVLSKLRILFSAQVLLILVLKGRLLLEVAIILGELVVILGILLLRLLLRILLIHSTFVLNGFRKLSFKHAINCALNGGITGLL